MTPFGWFLIVFALYFSFQAWLMIGMLRLLRMPKPQAAVFRKLSVIITAHNEEESIGRCLEALSQQDYPRDAYEVVVALDRCSDQTGAVTNSFRDKLPALTILEVNHTPEGVSPKKHALAQAVAAAQFDHFVFLDADVEPTRRHLAAINDCFEEGQVVVSLMKFFPPGNIWQEFLVFEKLVSWCIAGAGIGYQRPIISYGGNWGYTRQAFEAVEGFRGIRRSLSGDDDLLLQQMGRNGIPSRMCLNPDGWIRTEAPESWSAFLRQRRRHFSAGKHYRPGLQAGYLFFHLSNLILWIGPLFYPPAAALLLIKLIGDFSILHSGRRLFREEFSLPKSLLFDFLFMAYNTFIGPLGHLGKIRW